MSPEEWVKRHFQESIQTKKRLHDDQIVVGQIVEVSMSIVQALRNRGKVLLAGNGGSAADAQHIAAEFVSRFYFDRPALAAISLTTDTSIMTAIGNDYGFENLFSRQLEANAVSGDIYIALSTSGVSKNIRKSVEAAKRIGLFTVGLSGASGGDLKDLCDICICVPSTETPRIQEAHILIGHIICASVEREIFGGEI